MGELDQVNLHKKASEDNLKDHSLALWESLLESQSLVKRYYPTDFYPLSAFKPLLNLFFGFSALFKY